MYLIISILATITFTLLWVFIKSGKHLHFEYGALIFSGASIAWLVECIKFWIEGDGFIRTDQLWIDIVIALSTLLFGLAIYCLVVFIPIIVKKHKAKKNQK